MAMEERHTHRNDVGTKDVQMKAQKGKMNGTFESRMNE